MVAQDLDGSLLDDNVMTGDDEDRFRVGRDGDSLLTPFRCDFCTFLNIHGRLPVDGNPTDDLLLICIRRVLLDSFWARERSTVRSNMYEGLRYLEVQDRLGLKHCALRPQGPYPMRDDWGVGAACGLVLRSCDEGKNSKNIQFSTVRKMRSFLSNYNHTRCGGSGYAFMSLDGTGSRLSYSPTNSLWFKRCMTGLHRRMGDVWKPDKAVSRYVIRGCFSVLEYHWEAYGNDNFSKMMIAKAACIIITGYYASLRGEEVGKADIGGIRKHWKDGMNHPDWKHVPLILAGTFKGEIGVKLFVQPLAAVTKDGRNLAKWYCRYLETLRNEGYISGPLFRNDKGKPMSVAELDVHFHSVLLEVQRRFPNAIPDSVNVIEDYSVYRSLRRGATSEAQNEGIDQTVIESNNRWRKAHRAKGMVPGWSMTEHYTDANVSVKMLVRFSSELPS